LTDAENSSEMSLNFYKSTRRHIPEDFNFKPTSLSEHQILKKL